MRRKPASLLGFPPVLALGAVVPDHVPIVDGLRGSGVARRPEEPQASCITPMGPRPPASPCPAGAVGPRPPGDDGGRKRIEGFDAAGQARLVAREGGSGSGARDPGALAARGCLSLSPQRSLGGGRRSIMAPDRHLRSKPPHILLGS